MASWEMMQGETAKAYQAFKMYLRMGHRRSYQKLAQELGLKTLGTIQLWTKKYNWQERIRDFEVHDFDAVEGNKIKLMQQNQEQIIYDSFTDSERMLEGWRMKWEEMLHNTNNGEKSPTVSDVKKMVETRFLIDTMSRRTAGLPSSIRQTDEEKVALIPENRALILPGGISKNIEEQFETTDDDEYPETEN
jgi:hypothetical protein